MAAFFTGVFLMGAFEVFDAVFVGVAFFAAGALRPAVDFLAADFRAAELGFFLAVDFETDFFAAALPEADLAGLALRLTVDFLLAPLLRAALVARFFLLAAFLGLLAGIGASRPDGQPGSFCSHGARAEGARARKSKLRFLARFAARVQPGTVLVQGRVTGAGGGQPGAR
jgi:hypothetical protein